MKVVFERGDAHVVRVRPGCYVVVYFDQQHVQWTTPNASGGMYFCNGIGDRAFTDVCIYAASQGTRYRRKRDAVERVNEDAEVEA